MNKSDRDVGVDIGTRVRFRLVPPIRAIGMIVPRPPYTASNTPSPETFTEAECLLFKVRHIYAVVVIAIAVLSDYAVIITYGWAAQCGCKEHARRFFTGL